MEATCSSETSVDFEWTTRHYIPEDRTAHKHCCKNFKPYMEKVSVFHTNRSTFADGRAIMASTTTLIPYSSFSVVHRFIVIFLYP
jgi:hypothetical protein